MKNDITEKDIFNFVFYPELVLKKKQEFLINSPDFKHEIEFYFSLKNSLMEELPFDVKQKLASKIKAYMNNNIIYLYPVEEIKKRKHSNGIVLAAASPEERPKISTKTFYDEDKTYIIKVIKYEKSSKVFVFSTQYELMKDYTLIISPNNTKYHMKDNSGPLEIEMPLDPDSISIEFNLKQAQ